MSKTIIAKPTTDATAAEQERDRILAKLKELDDASTRPMRAIETSRAKGESTEEDEARLAALEAQAVTLRKRLAEVNAELAEAK